MPSATKPEILDQSRVRIRYESIQGHHEGAPNAMARRLTSCIMARPGGRFQVDAFIELW
jgi:hypothetical protein